MSKLIGHQPEAVLDLMRERRREGGRADSSGRKLALIVEGGGMRGVLSAGALLAMDVLGFRTVFDEVYATSAGAVNAAYFLSGQGRLGITVYFDDINNRRFINLLRVWRIVDVGFVYDNIVTKVKPLDEQALRAQPTDLFFSVTDLETGEHDLLDVKALPEPVPLMLKATSALPVLYNRPVVIGGRAYIDGGATCTLPILQAAKRGCTDILVVLTKSTDIPPERPTRLRRAILYWALGRAYPRMMNAYELLAERSHKDRELAAGLHRLEHVNIATVFPTASELIVDRMTLDRARLMMGAERMAIRTAEMLKEGAGPIRDAFATYK
jgi:predicted patatin/cPLA2 family phospholipase